MTGNVKKYLHRLAFAVFIFLFLHVTSMDQSDRISSWYTLHTVDLFFVVVMVLVTWEVVSWVTRSFEKRYGAKTATRVRLLQLWLVSCLVTLPLILASNYFAIYYLEVWVEGALCPEPVTKFWQTSLKSEVMLWLVIGFEMLKVYYKHNKKVEHERALMQKELLLSQFQSLKNQVNPHFLFNSFSVLSTLIEEDPHKASIFLNRLAKMYRYILENREVSLVSLEEELKFLDDYLYLLKTRHEESIKVDLRIDGNVNEVMLPTLSLQMLVENAVKHNRFSIRDPLQVEIYREGDSYLVVQNRLNQKTHHAPSTRIGLENVRKRFSLQSGKKVVVDRNEAYFTVKLPLLTTVPISS